MVEVKDDVKFFNIYNFIKENYEIFTIYSIFLFLNIYLIQMLSDPKITGIRLTILYLVVLLSAFVFSIVSTQIFMKGFENWREDTKIFQKIGISTFERLFFLIPLGSLSTLFFIFLISSIPIEFIVVFLVLLLILFYFIYRENVYTKTGIKRWQESGLKLAVLAERLDGLINYIKTKTSVSVTELLLFEQERKLFLEGYGDFYALSKQYNLEDSEHFKQINTYFIKIIEGFEEFKKELDDGLTIKLSKR